MRRAIVSVLAFSIACRGETPVPVRSATNDAPRVPVGLMGDWIRIAPAEFAGDTLSLRPDSTATGLIPWPATKVRMARISRWKVQFGSKDPASSRADWRQGHTDGGDAGCAMGTERGCVSMPMLCLGATKQYFCSAFKYTAPDSLDLHMFGLRYVRLPRKVSQKTGRS
jgi:hypothetical protein